MSERKDAEMDDDGETGRIVAMRTSKRARNA
jgi:hypothetical protein